MHLDNDGSVVKVDILSPYVDEFVDSHATAPRKPDEQGIPAILASSSNDPLYLLGLEIGF
ncbi:unnamed protein product [marine sediment metagenome]|uniref:Uncharacterized protein n=1 Tax=marine sediment metagenome TaxID=412755 RepID=X1QK69_9ZZZZ